MSTDRIKKQVVLRAPLDRVGRPISDADGFGGWFGVRFHGQLVAEKSVTATITPTTADHDVAKRQKPQAGTRRTWQVVAVEPPTRFAYRWHPCADEPDVDEEPTTLWSSPCPRLPTACC
jgi:uncharacterized protein YndB with AHSA1/START domain